MTDVALTLLALIGSGLTLELFTSGSVLEEDEVRPRAEVSGEELFCGNPS